MKKLCLKCIRKFGEENICYGLHEECFKNWFKLSSFERFQDVAAQKQFDSLSLPAKDNFSFFHGKFRKYSAKLGGLDYILKIEEHDYPELPATEYLCNQIFELLGVHVPPFYLIKFEEKLSTFVTKNFMSGLQDSNLIHLYHYLEEGEGYNCESLVKTIGNVTGKIVSQEDFVFLTLADSLIGNNDRHGRNLGFIQTPQGLSLAPFYDNPSNIGIEIASLLGADLRPRGHIYTLNSSEPNMTNYIEEWKRLGFENVVESFRKAVDLPKILLLVDKGFLTTKRKEALKRLITKRWQELCS